MEQLLNKISKELVSIRRDLHQIPEIGFKEIKTSHYIKKYLEALGYETEQVAKTGIIAVKKGTEESSIAFRADMDALEVTEQTGVDFESNHKGVMHACGHDGHMTILLGFANYLSTLEHVKSNIVLIFQPAEEGPGGAKVIVEEGVLLKYNVKHVFGLHLFPGIEEGIMGLTAGPMMAQSGEVDIKIEAKSSHGAMPQKGIDALVVAANLIQSYQSIVSRNISPLDTAVVTLGKLYGGEARNIIAKELNLEGTIRAFDLNVYKRIKDRMKSINEGLERMYGVNIDLTVRDLYPPVLNDQKLYEHAKKVIPKKGRVDIDPMMLSEDFSYYQEAVPGLFMFLGTKNESKGYTHPLHSCYFNFDEGVLIKGVEAYINICKGFDLF
ncbi:M20 metallopeptidase family protein [Haloplasma contractile]|uniref:N-acyl-L-amino acid amidohydrolase protein n=1 Tax=Haloplasma contractile SSD-17B TaxID=1033810 RepID=U2FI30_9MOLU|nr:M20 family metallopeptidase [Haloplasma contractile]ERJ12470.1 N-acyl-L-amino acid amidohydrolase protein [Haloplasma contractile SSD-17B]